MVRRVFSRIWSPALNREMQVLAYGHYGQPILVFPSGLGNFYDFENYGMIDALGDLLHDGKIKIYCTESNDWETWLNDGWDFWDKCRRFKAFEHYVVSNLAEAIRFDCRSPHQKIATTGCSWGAYHAANFALKHPHIFGYALCMSGRYDLGRTLGGDYNEDAYFNDPMAYVPNLWGGPLEHVRRNTHINLVVGQGAHENNCLPETHRLADILASKGISHERNIWGHDVEHHWYWWRRQARTYFGQAFG